MKFFYTCLLATLWLNSVSQTTGTIDESACIHFSYDDNGNREVATILICAEMQRQDNLESLAEELGSDTNNLQESSSLISGNGTQGGDSLLTDIEIDYNALVSVYPNPVSALLNIKCDEVQSYSFVVLNAEGRLIARGEVAGGTKLIDVSSWSAGDYIIQVRFQNTNQVSTYKVVVL